MNDATTPSTEVYEAPEVQDLDTTEAPSSVSAGTITAIG